MVVNLDVPQKIGRSMANLELPLKLFSKMHPSGSFSRSSYKWLLICLSLCAKLQIAYDTNSYSPIP